MRNETIEELRKYEQEYWWHVGRRFILESVLKRFFKHKDRKILDIGCGTGINLNWLKDFGDVVGVDNNEEAIKFCERYGKATLGSATKLPISNESQDLITAFDILEHLKNDNEALQKWHRVLKHNGYLFISVPAYQWLFGPHDKNLMHYRRYLLSNLVTILEKAGFKPLFASYFFTFTFPVFLIQRVLVGISGRAPGYTAVPICINSFLIFLEKFEAWLLRFMTLPFGSSILILARKNDQTDS